MNQKPLFLTVTLIALLTIGGAFWLASQRAIAPTIEPVVTDPVVETPIETQAEPKQDFSSQHIVAIPGSQQVWYEVPEMGIKLLLSKEAAEELVYRYTPKHDSEIFVEMQGVESQLIKVKDVESAVFFGKKIVDYNKNCGTSLCRTEDIIFFLNKVPGVYHDEMIAFGSKFLKQLKGFYLITGGLPQAVPFANDEEEKKFNDAVGRFLPKIPRIQDIKIEFLQP